MERSYLEKNLISGVYTNKDKYLKRFTENWNEYYGNLPLIYNVREGKINENMEKLRHDFIQSGKRYWLFMDDDILFTRNDVIETALKHMQENDLSLVTTYQSTNYNLVKIADPSNLNFEFICWSAGYFMLIDSEKCGLVPFDLNLPTTHGSNSDIAYCLDIIEHNPEETLIGIAPTLIFHDDAGYSPKASTPFKIDKSNEQEVNKSVEEFFKNCDYLVFDSTFSDDLKEKAIESCHSTAKEAATFAKNVNVSNLILTHFSARYKDEKVLLDEAKTVHDSVIAAKDQLTVKIE